MYRIKSQIKRDSITQATRHITITTIFKYMPSNNFHMTLYTQRNLYSTPGTNIIIIETVHRHRHTQTHTDTHTHTHPHTHTHTLSKMMVGAEPVVVCHGWLG